MIPIAIERIDAERGAKGFRYFTEKIRDPLNQLKLVGNVIPRDIIAKICHQLILDDRITWKEEANGKNELTYNIWKPALRKSRRLRNCI